MTGTIKKLLENDEMVCRVLTDLQAAFDTINHYGIRSKENDYFHSFPINRKQYVSVEGCFFQTQIVRYGISKSFYLGPLLFLMYINDLKNTVDNELFTILQMTLHNSDPPF